MAKNRVSVVNLSGNAPAVRTKKKEEEKKQPNLQDALAQAKEYAQRGPVQTRDVASSLLGGMNQLNTGDKKNFNWDKSRRAEIDQAEANKYLRLMGLFDSKDYALDKATTTLSSTKYLKELQDELPLQKAFAAVEDDYNRALEEMLQEQTAAWESSAERKRKQVEWPQEQAKWQHMYNNLNAMNEETSPWFWGYADYLLNGDKTKEFDPGVYNDAWDAMSEAERQQDFARLKNQFDTLNWNELIDKNRYDKNPYKDRLNETKTYTQRVPVYDAYLKTVNDELARREKLEALQNSIRATPDYSTLSQYVNPGTATEWLDLFGGKNGNYTSRDRLGYFLNNPLTHDEQEALFNAPGSVGVTISAYVAEGYDYLTVDELADYNALYNAGRYDEASEYLTLLRPELLRRRAGPMEQYYRTKAVSGVPSAVGSWAESVLQGVGNIVMMPFQAYETAKGMDNPYSSVYDLTNAQGWTRNEQLSWIENQEGVPELLKAAEKFGYTGITGAADNFARLAAAGFNPTVSLAFAGMQGASGSLYDTAGRNDIEAGAKIIKALSSAVYEVGTEKIGLDALFDMGKENVFKYVAGVMASELGEETVNTLAEDMTDVLLSVIFDYESEIKSGADVWDDVLQTWYQTAGSSLFMGGSGAVNMTMQNSIIANRVNKNGDIDTVISIAQELGEDTEAGRLGAKLAQKKASGKKLSINEIGALVRSATEQIGKSDTQAIQDVLTDSIVGRLVQLGEAEETAKKTAPAISKMYLGEKLSMKDHATINWSDNADQVMKELHATIQEGDEARTGKGWVTKARQNVMAEQLNGMANVNKLNKAIRANDNQQEQNQQPTQKPQIRKAAESAAQKQKAVKGKHLDVRQVAFMDENGHDTVGEFQRVEKKNGEFVAVVSEGVDTKEISLDDVQGSGSDGLTAILEYANNASYNMSADQANYMLKAYQAEGGDAADFIDNYEKAYFEGYTGLENKQGGREGVSAIAFEQGKAEAAQDEQNRVKKASQAMRTTTGNVSWIGKVNDFSQITGKGGENSLNEAMRSLSDSQKNVVKLVEAFAEKFKVDVVLYESDLDSPVTMPNGQYVSSTNTVYLDVLGGTNDTMGASTMRKNGTLGSAMLQYLGHELTHAIESGSAEGYAVYRQAVREALRSRNMSYEALVREELESAQAQGEKLTLGGAEAEVIAKASEFMLENTAFIKSAPAGVKATIQNTIKNFARKVREVFAMLTGGNKESRALRELKDGMYRYVDDLQKLWDVAAEEMVSGEQVEQGAETVPVEDLKPEKQFSMRSTVEKREDGLIAVHNLKADDIMGTLNLGGFPMPSIAIVKAKHGHTKYGPYSVIFSSGTIDPQASIANRVYGADAWTPVFPTVETEVLADEMWKIKTTISDLATKIDEEYGGKARSWFGNFGGTDTTTKTMGDIQDSAWNNGGMLAAYLADNGENVDILEKDVPVERGYNTRRADMYDKMLEIVAPEDLKSMKARELIDKYKKQLAEEITRPFAMLVSKWNSGDLKAGTRMLDLLKQAIAYEEHGRDTNENTKKVKDYYATENAMREQIDRNAFNAWVKGQMQGALGASGIYNGKDRFTPSGNRRSFSQLHDSITADNVIKSMLTQEESSTNPTDAQGLIAAASTMYKSIAEIKDDAYRLGEVSEEEYQMHIAHADNLYHDFLNAIEAWDSAEIEEVGSLLVQAAKKKMKASSISTLLKRNGYNKATVEVAKQAEQLIKTVQSVPTGYFEAKPMRVVGFDEIAQIVAPDDISEELEAALQERGIPYTTYESGNDTDRIEKMNAVEGVKFSLREVDGQQVVWVEENVLNQREDGESVASFIQRYIKSHIGELYTIIESGSKVYLGENLPGEYAHSKYTEQLYSHRRDLYSVKMQAAQNLGELIEIASNRRWEKTKHQHNKDAKYGIYKYDSQIAFPAEQKVKAYTVELLILNASDGKKYLYDVQNIKKNTAVASALYFKGRGRSVETSPRTSDVLNDSVLQSAESVNSKHQYARRDQTETEAFKRWFGDSEVTDDNGEPLVVYHTTNSTFTSFDREKLGTGADSNAADGYLAATAHVGFWFNTKQLNNKGMGKNAMPVYLSVQKMYEAGTLDGLVEEIWDAYPGDYDTEDPSIEQAAEAGEYYRGLLESRGYDGIAVDDTEFGGKSYIVFEPEQIKSATDNVGTFDPQNPDIRYARRDDLSMMDVRQIVGSMEITSNMNATEKDMLTRYKAKLLVVQDMQSEIDQQRAILRSDEATADEKAAAKARIRIYTAKQKRANNYLRSAEGSDGFARMMATSQELARRLSASDAKEAADAIATEIEALTERLATVNKTLEQTQNAMKNAEVRAMFDTKKLEQEVSKLKTEYGLKMSRQELKNRLAALYAAYAEQMAKGKVGQSFANELRTLAEDMYNSQKVGQNYQSEMLEDIGMGMGGSLQLSDSEVEQLNAQGISYSQFKRALSPYVKVTRGGTGSQVLAAAQAASYYDNGGILSAKMEGVMNDVDALNILYDTFSAEKAAMEEKNAPGMTQDQMVGQMMGDIMASFIMPDMGGETAKRLKDALRRGTSDLNTVTKALAETMEEAKTSARNTDRLWGKISQYQLEAKNAAEYYRALEEKRRLTELKEQREELTSQLQSEAADKLAAYRERQMDLNAIREQTARNKATEKRIRTKVKRLDKLIRRETDQKHIPEGFKPVVEEMMRIFISQDGIDIFGNPDTQSGQRAIATAYAAYEQLKQMDGDDMQQMSEYYDYDVAQNLLELKDLMKRLGAETALVGTERLRTRAAMMERAEEIVDMISHTAENIGSIQIGEKRVRLEQLAAETKKELDEKPTFSVYDGARGKAENALNTLRYGNMTPAYFFRDLNLSALTEMSNELFKAEDEYGKLYKQAQDKVAEMEQKYHYWDWIFDDPLTFTTQQGLEIKQTEKHKITIDKGLALQLYATWKRESQRDPLIQTNHLRDGGFAFATMQKDGKKLVGDTTAHKISAMDMRTIEGYLTKEQKAFADEFVQYLTDLGATLGNETSMEMFGIKKFKDTYYFPIQVQRGQLYQNSNTGNGTTDDSRIKHMAFTNRRINGAIKPITAGSFVDVGTRHIQQMLTYHTFAVPLENLNKVLNQSFVDIDTGSTMTIRLLIEQKFGKEAINYLERFIADLNGGVRKDSTERGFIRMLSGFKKGATAASLSVAIQQPTSIVRAMAEVDARYFVPFTHGDTNTQYKNEWEQLTRHSGVAVIKEVGGIDMTRSASMADDLAGNLEEGYNTFKKVKLALGMGAPKGERAAAAMRQWDNAFGKLAELGDKVAWIAMWRAIKNETKALNPNMDITSDAFLDKAGERFNEVMRLTQVYDSTLARSQWMRSSSGLMKMVTSFGAEGTLTANMLYDGFKNGDVRTKAKTAAIFLASQIITAAAAAIIKAGRDDDKDKTYAEKYLAAMGNALGGWGGAFNPLSLLPGVRDIMNLLDGYDVERSDMSIVSDLIKEVGKVTSGKYADNPWKGVENAGGAIANAFGIPLKNVMRDARTLYNTALGIFAPTRTSNNRYVMQKDALDNFALAGIWEPDTKASAYYAKLCKAIMNGDKAEEEGLREYLSIIGKDEKTVKSQVKIAAKELYINGNLTDDKAYSLLVKNGSAKDKAEAYWQVEEWKDKKENGKESTYKKYDDFFDAVETGVNLKSTIKIYTDNGVEKKTLSGQITDRYKQQLAELWMAGKKGEYANLLARVLTAYEALGYDRKEKQKDIERARDKIIKESKKK